MIHIRRAVIACQKCTVITSTIETWQNISKKEFCTKIIPHPQCCITEEIVHKIMGKYPITDPFLDTNKI